MLQLKVLLLLVAAACASATLWESYRKFGHSAMWAVDFDLKDGSIRKATNGFKPTQEELQKISAQFQNPSDVMQNGITIEGVKYDGVNGDANKLVGKSGENGVIVIKNAHYENDALAGVYWPSYGISEDEATSSIQDVQNNFAPTMYSTFLKKGNPFMQAVNFLLKDGSILAKNSGFNPTQDELKKISDQFNNPSDVQANGITIGGVNYDGVSGDANKLVGKKGDSGVIVVKDLYDDRDALAGVYDSQTSAADADSAMENTRNAQPWTLQ